MAAVVITNATDLNDFMEKFLDDIGSAIENGIDFSTLNFDPISIKLVDENPEHNSTITTQIMKMFVDFNDKIEDMMAVAKGSDLTDDEKSKLELRIKVEEGSTDIIAPLAQMIVQGIPAMSLEQTEALLQTVRFTVALYLGYKFLRFTAGKGIGTFKEVHLRKLSDQREAKRIEYDQKKLNILAERRNAELAYQEHRDEKDHEEKLALIDAQAKQIEKAQEFYATVFEDIPKLYEMGEKAEKKICRDLAIEADRAAIQIDGTLITKDELKEVGKVTRGPRVEPRTEVIEDDFKVTVVDFGTESGNVKINLIGSDYQFKDVVIPDNLLEDSDLAIVANAKSRTPIHAKLTVKNKNGVLYEPTFIQSVVN